MDYKVSIIVPVYNVRDRINKTLECMKDQTLKEFELLLIDDGSPDDSSKVSDEYLKQTDVNYRIIKKKNGGVSSARNLGIIEARGEYIQFLDSDDYIDKTMIEKLYNKAKEIDADIVYSGFMFEESNGTKLSDNSANLKEGEYTGKETALGLIYGVSHTHIMANLFRRSLLIENNITFDENRKYGEDISFEIKAYCYAKKVYCLSEINTHYVKWDESVTNNVNKNFLDMYYSNKETLEYLDSKFNDKELKKAMIEYRIPVSILTIFAAFAINKKMDSELNNFIGDSNVRSDLRKMKIKNFNSNSIKYYLLSKSILFNVSAMKRYYQKRS